MLHGAMVAPIASPNSMARSTAALLSTGSVPGSARSTGQACVLGAAPKAVEAPEKILEAVDSCVCVSRPITTSHCMAVFLISMLPVCRPGPARAAGCLSGPGGLAQVPVGGLLEGVRSVQQRRLAEVVADQLP